MKIIVLSLMAISLNSFAAQTADKPLSTLSVGDVKPNVMFILDDSGSMAWSHMPDEVVNWQKTVVDVPDWRKTVGYRSALCNGVYYDPTITYSAPKNANGTDRPNSSFNAAWYDGFSTGSTTTHDLSNAFFAYDRRTGYVSPGNWKPDVGTPGEQGAVKVQAFYWALKSGIVFDKINLGPQCSEYPKGNIDSNSAASTTSWTKVLVPDTTQTAAVQAAQKTNFANWFSYYRTRILMMKSSAGTAFSSINDRYRVGFSSINKMPTASTSQKDYFLNIDNYDSAQKSAWYAKLYGTYPNGGTPLRTALNTIGQMYSGSALKDVADPMQYTCQQNFSILTTDGYWNGDAALIANKAMPDQDNDDNIPNPMKDSKNSKVNTLADVAMYYFKNDIRPSMTNNVPGVKAFAGGDEGRQIMRTYTLGLGVDGQLDKSKYPEPLSGVVIWPTAVADSSTTIDDLWHAAVNGGGQYFSAKNPARVAEDLAKALSDIEAKTSSVGAAAVSTPFMSPNNNFIYYSSFKTIEWTGEVEAKVFDLDTSSLKKDNKWSAQEQLSKMDHTKRKIYTCTNNSCNKRLDFDTKNSALISSIGQGSLNSAMNVAQVSNNTAQALIDYLRGDTSNEIKANANAANSLYRVRAGRLGAVIHGGASTGKEQNKAYTDEGYASFLLGKAKRQEMVYVPANDGMLHAFNATTGAEEWAFVPPTLAPKLWQLADRAFSNNFKFFADGAPTIADIYSGGSWKTILVAGLRGGGNEYYALDITDPLDPQPLWNFSHSKLGKTYGFPVVGKIAGEWKVLLSSGYDNSDGKGYVFVLNAGSGPNSAGEPEQLISNSCSASDGLCGLAKIGVLYENKNVDDTIVMAYAGDLAISTAPTIQKTTYKSSNNTTLHYLTFGTGRYLNQADMGSSNIHTFYGLLVDPSASAMDSAFTELKTSSALSQLVLSKTCDKTIKDNLGGSVSMVDYVDTSKLSDACTTASDFDTITLKRTANTETADTPEALLTCINQRKGWRADMGISKERLANDPIPRGENALFNTSIPGGNACIADGVGRQYTFPMQISKNWLCSNPNIGKEITVGKNMDGRMLEDPKQLPTIVTNKNDSLQVFPGDPPTPSSPLLLPFKGRRSGWTEIVN
jgi:type IV pilus assembly protein PilY1